MFSQRITMMRQQFFILLASMVVVLSGTIAYFAYHNLTYDRARTRQIRHAGFVEKQTVLPDKSVINYGEGPNNGIPLLLIHGQQVSWQDYSQVLTELSSRYHVFAVDCYGHGGSSKDPKKYTARANSDDIVWFINNVVKDQVVVSGHSSGGLIATLVAATAPDMVRGLVIEDAPFFSTEPDRAPKTFAGHGFKDMHDFLGSGEPNFTRYSLEHTYLAHLFGEKNFDNLVRKPALKRLDRRPHEIPRVWYYPPGWKINEIYDLTANMQDGTGSYDLRFGDAFYDYSCARSSAPPCCYMWAPTPRSAATTTIMGCCFPPWTTRIPSACTRSCRNNTACLSTTWTAGTIFTPKNRTFSSTPWTF